MTSRSANPLPDRNADARRTFRAGIAALASASRVGEIGDAVQTYVEASGEGYGILRDYVGHGIGRKMHEGPTVFNYRVADLGPEVRPGLCVAIEPMIVAGDEAIWVQADSRLAVQIDPADNTVVQRLVPAEGSGSIAITDDGAVWITAHDVLKLYRIPPD